MLTPSTGIPDDGAASSSGPQTTRIQPEFHGRAGEYFGIWIVNVLLSIVTLGIYSAWATVRTQRYFYGNTRLAGSSFEYLADPVRILKGRLIAYAVVIALALSSHFMPLLYLGLVFAMMLLVPVLVWLAARFRARYSAWRGVRFRFDGGVAEAYGPFFAWLIVSGISLSLLYPVAKMRQQAYLVDGHRFGRTRFAFDGDAGSYYGPYVVALVAGVALLVALGAGMAGLAAVADQGDAGAAGPPGPRELATIYGFVLVFYAVVFALMAYVRTRYLNLMWRNSKLGRHAFESTLRVRDVVWIYASNLMAIVCTLGLAAPWAMVRLARYRAAHFAVLASGSLEDFLVDVEDERSSAGVELIDALDIGVDIGL